MRLPHDLRGDRPLVIRADNGQRRSAEHEVEERLVAGPEANLGGGPPQPHGLTDDSNPMCAVTELGVAEGPVGLESGERRAVPSARIDELDASRVLAEVVAEQLDIGRGGHGERGFRALDSLGQKRPDDRLELIVRAIAERRVLEHRRTQHAALDEVVDAHPQRSRERRERAGPDVRAPACLHLGDAGPAHLGMERKRLPGPTETFPRGPDASADPASTSHVSEHLDDGTFGMSVDSVN